MVILSVTFALSLSLFGKLFITSFIQTKPEATQLAYSILERSVNDHHYVNEEFVIDEYQLKKTVEPYEGMPHLLKITVEVSGPARRKKVTVKRLVYVP